MNKKLSLRTSLIVVILFFLFISCSKEVVKKTQMPQEYTSEINVYFNKDADTSYAFPNNKANFDVNLEDKLIRRINGAKNTIDIAAYEINLPRLVDNLIERANEGIKIRFIIDAKDQDENLEYDSETIDRYTLMKLYLEKMNRGNDKIRGTLDDIKLLADSPIFTVSDSTIRKKFDLPLIADDYPTVTVNIGKRKVNGNLLVEGEEKNDGSYYSPGYQMHNKFVIIDTQWTFTGSWNYTVTGLYGSDEAMEKGQLDGNQQHVVEIRNKQLASIYLDEFEEMWGSCDFSPLPGSAKFHSRKRDNTQHELNINGTKVEVYFSPSDNVLDKITNTVEREATRSVYFTIFSFSYQPLVDVLKVKWEGSVEDLEGERTDFNLKGIFDSAFWNQWWSASTNMTSRIPSKTSKLHPMRRWKYPAPVYKDQEARKLHAKTMIIDERIVIVGSANWSGNADKKNDENTLIIHDRFIANQFMQEFRKR